MAVECKVSNWGLITDIEGNIDVLDVVVNRSLIDEWKPVTAVALKFDLNPVD